MGRAKARAIWDKLGAHVRELEGVAGVAFAVWAPNAPASAWSAISTAGTDAST